MAQSFRRGTVHARPSGGAQTFAPKAPLAVVLGRTRIEAGNKRGPDPSPRAPWEGAPTHGLDRQLRNCDSGLRFAGVWLAKRAHQPPRNFVIPCEAPSGEPLGFRRIIKCLSRSNC